MYNNSGGAAFEPQQTLTSNAGAFEIDSGTDFTPEQNFVIGLASLDDAGRMRPLAIVCLSAIKYIFVCIFNNKWFGSLTEVLKIFSCSCPRILIGRSTSSRSPDIGLAHSIPLLGPLSTQRLPPKIAPTSTSPIIQAFLAPLFLRIRSASSL